MDGILCVHVCNREVLQECALLRGVHKAENLMGTCLY